MDVIDLNESLKRLKLKKTTFRHTQIQGEVLEEVSRLSHLPKGVVLCKILDCPIEKILELITD